MSVVGVVTILLVSSCALIIHALVAGAICGFVVRRFGWHITGDPTILLGAFWPVAAPVFLVSWSMYLLGRWAYQRFCRVPVVLEDRDADEISSSEEYRRMAAMVRRYEERLPVMEREQ